MSETSTQNWFALHVRPRREKSVARSLSDKGYDTLLPLFRARRTWSGKNRDVELPLFPGYLFCRFDVTNRLPILATTWVDCVVGIGKTPCAISESEITAVKTVTSRDWGVEPWPFLQTGHMVRIETGPFYGVEGILLRMKGVDRLVVSVQLLRRSVAVEIDRRWVLPCSPTSRGMAAGRTAEAFNYPQ